MKQAGNNEMEVLLRRYGRRAGEATSTGMNATSIKPPTLQEGGGAHLDADELNAYAENALPQSARTRYMAHLADCDVCRHAATELTLAAGMPLGETEQRDAEPVATPSQSWRSWLLALFSPPVLRYAVPALALFVVAAIALVAIRSNKNSEQLVARNEQTDPAMPSKVTEPGAPAPTTGTQPAPAGAPASTPSSAPQSAPNDDAKVKDTETKPTQPGGVPAPQTEVTTSGASVDGQNNQPAQSRERDETGFIAQDRPAAAPPPATTAADSSPSEAGKRREQNAEQAAQERKSNQNDYGYITPGADSNKSGQSGGGASNSTVVDSTTSAQRAKARKPATGRSNRGLAGSTAEGASETRSVGGRTFRRQGNLWIDSAYGSSRPTTSVSRNSPQYRALVAADPGIASAVNQLGGEVIIISQGKAYRIR